jgi:hypothetical protein
VPDPSRVAVGALERALRISWAVDSCDPVDVDNWTPDNPARGQCGATALVVRDLLGGYLVEAEVLFANGDRQGFHYWNRVRGIDIDFTIEQFSVDEVLQTPRVVAGPPEISWIAEAQYLILRARVLDALLAADPSLTLD